MVVYNSGASDYLSSQQWSGQKPMYSVIIYVVSCDFVVLSSQCLYKCPSMYYAMRVL